MIDTRLILCIRDRFSLDAARAFKAAEINCVLIPRARVRGGEWDWREDWAEVSSMTIRIPGDSMKTNIVVPGVEADAELWLADATNLVILNADHPRLNQLVAAFTAEPDRWRVIVQPPDLVASQLVDTIRAAW